MRIAQIIPGTGDNFYCENCLRDVALVRAVQKLGHDVTVLPMYLPVRIDDAEPVTDAPIFFGGINVYLQQKSSLFRKTPRWIDRLFDSPGLLTWLARRANMTGAKELGRMTVSMLQGSQGRQTKEFTRLIEWLAAPPNKPDVVLLSNMLLAGLAKVIKRELDAPVLCLLQDEDGFLDGLGEPYSTQAWQLLAALAGDVDAFVAVSEYYADVMRRRLNLDTDKVRVIYPGISFDGFEPAPMPPKVATIGYLSRMCPDRGLDTLVDAFIELKHNERLRDARLRISGGTNPGDENFVERLRRRLTKAGCLDDVEFLGRFDRTARQAFLKTLSVLSVPEKQPVAFGMYVIEALAAAVPVVEPAHGAFPELLQATGGGLLYDPKDAQGLRRELEKLLLDPDSADRLGNKAREAVLVNFGAPRAAEQIVGLCEEVIERLQRADDA